MTDPTVLHSAIGRYPHSAPVLDGQVTSLLLRLEDARIKPVSRAFAPMVREGRFEVSEMAIATFLMAKAAGKPLVLLPVVMAARFQEAALLCRADSPVAGPIDLAGRRLGVRAYSQATGLPTRGIRPSAERSALGDLRGCPSGRVPGPTLGGACPGRVRHDGHAGEGRAGRGDRRQ